MNDSHTLEALGFKGLKAIQHGSDLKFNNSHYSATFNNKRVFIKTYQTEKSFLNETVALAALKDSHMQCPQLIKQGQLKDRFWWSALEWIDFDKADIEKTANSPVPYILAQTLSDLHSIDVSQQHDRAKLKTLILTRERLTERIDLAKDFEPSAYKLMHQILSRLSEGCFKGLGKTCMNHGDFGMRNIRSHQSKPFLFDYEHAVIADPLLDFGKIWDRELKNLSDRNIFWDNYTTSSSNLSLDTIETYMLPVRLWVAAGIFPYSIRKNDREFLQHGLYILEQVKTKLGI